MILSNASCDYTGGGIYVFKAKFGSQWVYGALDNEYKSCFPDQEEQETKEEQEMKPADRDMTDLAVCDLYASFDRLGEELAADGVDTGSYNSYEVLSICREIAAALAEKYDRSLEDGDDPDWTEMVCFDGNQMLRDRLLRDAGKEAQPDLHIYEFTVHANAFVTISVEAESREAAKEKLRNDIASGGFVCDHYTEFEIDSDAEIIS